MFLQSIDVVESEFTILAPAQVLLCVNSFKVIIQVAVLCETLWTHFASKHVVFFVQKKNVVLHRVGSEKNFSAKFTIESLAHIVRRLDVLFEQIIC